LEELALEIFDINKSMDELPSGNNRELFYAIDFSV